MSFIRAADMSDGRVLFNSAQCINELARSRIRKGIGLPGDVLLSHKGTVGKVAYAPAGCPDFVCSPQTTFWRVMDERVLDRHFLFAYMQSADFKAQLASRKGETDMADYVSLTAQRQLQIPVPGILLQREIGKVFSILNDRITLLRETNATLEAIAQALFKSWFVDFDPVRAKAEGRQPEGMDATTAALFPDSFEESELGLVPNGWNMGSVGDLASQKKGSVNPLASPGVLYEHYSLPAFDNGQAPVFELGQEIKSNKTPLPEEAVLLSKLNPHIPRVWLPVSCGDNAVCSTEFLAYSPRDGASKELIYCLFGSSEFQQQLCQLVTGTSNSHQRVKPDQVLAIKLPIAGKPALKTFTESVRPLFERIHANRLQAQTLTQLRDTLLPRLISGQLRLPESAGSAER
ncbi:restriction endonuclease subunit S [Pseudomonas aeruginosa]|uniref:restriction endonuclease subunit S n=1 Tax=Pseudomonas aeruginosa TaxID=287 RepID=UPI0015CE13F2|nr:restriction endonuclease subunit S [Pseudomonas aeruginosa]MDG9824375.1 restriction endonuclease subunit S [Pseudomonas aeruginosa]MDG9936720.1 restriction endonuclease subunit S [Pseudomonas aeruginosa]MDH0530993.1 restriction endonuclease subunit S [Pseudomonas aeruginosa]MDH0536648.1 restriction endonuclease subunit S [Pseudomonas aeruginosa]WKA33988.1 restriction endonuclease subunit S [Pseudomonas aeruginosa]